MSATDPYVPPVRKKGGTSTSIKTTTSDGEVYSHRVSGPPKKIGVMSTKREWDPLNPPQSAKENC